MKRVLTIISAFLLTFCIAAETYAQTDWSGNRNAGWYSGEVVLTGNVTQTGTINVAGSSTLTIDLNGYSITYVPTESDKVVLYCPAGSTLTIKDSKGGGYISGSGMGNHGGCAYIAGTFNLLSGTLKNGNAVRGGGVYIQPKGTFYMSGGSIEDCVATRTDSDNDDPERVYTNGTGGGVFVEPGGYFAMTGGTIRNCSTSVLDRTWVGWEENGEKKGLYVPAMGGGVFVNAYADAGATYIYDQYDPTYRGKFWFNKGLIENCHSGIGGGVCVHTTVSRNIAGANGRFTMDADAEIRNCTANYPPGNARYGGGGVFVAGNGDVDGGLKGVFNMRGGKITNCSTKSNGGGVKCNGEMNMGDAEMVDCPIVEYCKCVGENPEIDTLYYSQSYGGGIQLYNATLNMTEGRIENNIAFSGGGMMVWGTKCVFTMNGANAIISDNVVKGVNGSGNGGGVYVQEATFNFEHGTITNNTAARYGGGININATAKLNLNGICNITFNKANAGGAISQEAGECEIDIKSDGVLIEGNEAIIDEGIDYESSETARGQGGGILIEKGTFKMSKGKIINNIASSNGGGVSCYVRRILGDITATITGGEISGNSAVESGGGINLFADRNYNPEKDETANDVVVNLTGGILHSNSAENGGGIYVYVNEDNSTAKMNIGVDGTPSVRFNKASNNGGAIGLSNGTVVISRGNFTNNTAENNGGALYLGGGSITTNGGTFQSNSAKNGGAICLENGILQMAAGEVKSNNASQYGGGIYVTNTSSNSKDVTLSSPNVVFEENSADMAGGGMAVNGNINLDFKGSLERNTANNGGGLYVAGGAVMDYQGGMIRHNKANGTSNTTTTGYKQTAEQIHGFGGGVFVDDNSSLTFSVADGGLGFYGNDANTGGDDIFANGEGTDVLLPVVGEMELTGFNIPVAKNGIFWVEDYMTNDVEYNLGPHILGEGHSPIRYQDALKSAEVIGRLDDVATYYETISSGYLSLALGYELLFVKIIKQGLDPGDAAIVNVSYSKTGETSSSEWVQHQKALLVGPESGDASVIVALPPNAWKFEEETAWSENYTATNATQKIKFENQTQVDDNGPVTFENTKKAKSDITIHDEDNVENRMRPTL